MRKTIALLGILVLASCSSMKVHTDHDPTASFSSLNTYAWKLGDGTVEAENPLSHKRMLDAVDAALAEKGMRKVSGSPDAYITYYADSKEEVRADTTHMGYGYSPGWYYGGRGYWGGGMGGMSTSTTRVRAYEVGTIVVDMWAAGDKKLVWRGQASDTISESPKKNHEKITTAVSKMFAKYPPTDG